MRRVAVLGSTGSIGVKTLEVIADFPDRLTAVAMSTRARVDKLALQVADHNPAIVNITEAFERVDRLDDVFNGRVTTGVEGLVELVEAIDADLIVVATVGAVGVRPTLAAIERGMDIALANKEVLVTAGEIVMRRAREKGVHVLPIDSEHNAIAQCLNGEAPEHVERLILTASGGPFRDKAPEAVREATVEQALAHPTWEMGPKITIDSATMMNKGFEVIEAMRLFDLPIDRVDVVVHPQSIVHSMVEFVDGSVIAQMGVTDMYFPIQNILLTPDRAPNKHDPLDLAALGTLTFEPVSLERFPCLRLAFEAAREGGTAPVVLNAANEIAVERFLAGAIRFGRIAEIIEQTLAAHTTIAADTLETIEEADIWAREEATRVAND